MVELCTCSGGGTDAWIDCTGSCFPPCVGDIECGGEICNAAQYCQTCSGGSSSCRGRTLVADACPNPAEMVFNAFCDDDTDCAETDECMAVYGDVVRLQCARSDLFEGGCGQGSGYRELCEDAGDCTDCGTSCVPAMFADWSTPGYEVGICI
jgi:hypothetical protein